MYTDEGSHYECLGFLMSRFARSDRRYAELETIILSKKNLKTDLIDFS